LRVSESSSAFEFPVLSLAIVEEYLADVLFETSIERHNSSGIRREIGNVSSSAVFPGGLSGEDQESVIDKEDTSEEEEANREDHKDNPNASNV
jgi:hypothetical protein